MFKTVPVSVTPRRHNPLAGTRSSSVFPVRGRSNHPLARRVTPTGSRRAARTHSLLASFILALALAATSTLAAPPADAAAGSRMDRTERGIVKLINSYRARHGRPRLRASRRLNRAADRHSREMVAHDFFAHSSRNGTAATTRVRRSSDARTVGENIAFLGAGERRAARRVVDMWIGSPGHRAVLLNSSFHRIGVGRRGGDLGGSRGDAFTADFASRR